MIDIKIARHLKSISLKNYNIYLRQRDIDIPLYKKALLYLQLVYQQITIFSSSFFIISFTCPYAPIFGRVEITIEKENK